MVAIVAKMNGPQQVLAHLAALTTPANKERTMATRKSSCAPAAQQVNESSPVEYRDIPGFPGYRAGSDGTIWSAWSWKRIGQRMGSKSFIGETWRQFSSGWIDDFGYRHVTLRRGGKIFRRAVHRLVLEAFVGPRPKGMECRHFPDSTPSNCRLENLRWDTRKNNHDDKIKDGTKLVGEKNPRARLTPEIVRKIRAARGMELQKVTAQRFGVKQCHVSAIQLYQLWAHVS